MPPIKALGGPRRVLVLLIMLTAAGSEEAISRVLVIVSSTRLVGVREVMTFVEAPWISREGMVKGPVDAMSTDWIMTGKVLVIVLGTRLVNVPEMMAFVETPWISREGMVKRPVDVVSTDLVMTIRLLVIASGTRLVNVPEMMTFVETPWISREGMVKRPVDVVLTDLVMTTIDAELEVIAIKFLKHDVRFSGLLLDNASMDCC
jgi:hypothetical protein